MQRVALHVERGGEEGSASAVLDANGDLRVRHVDGTWHVLVDDGSSPFLELYPTDPLPVPSRGMFPPPLGRGESVVAALYVDQWRPWPSERPELTRVWADLPSDEASSGPSDHEPVLSLANLCPRATSWIESPDEGGYCRLYATEVDGMFLIEVDNWAGGDTFVAVGDRDHLRVVTRVGRVTTGPTRSGATHLRHVHRRARDHGETLLLETESSLLDHDIGVLEAYGYTARHMTACAHDGDIRTLRCGARIPLAYDPYTQELREVVVPSSFPFAWRETHDRSSRAVVALRPDGSLRVTLQEGCWEDLAGESEHNPLPVATPVGDERTIIVPMFPDETE